jgi:lipopolysaccharide/colanic/teichoic acid biosynthesis glycosyltransferase
MAIRLNMGTPVFYRQPRPGLNEKSFVLLKFRTMSNGTDKDGKLLSDGARLTRLGRFLRLTSLDELPQFINILRGEMSLIGPRPLLERYLPYYTHEERLRHTVRPGVTGWAQIHGRNDVPIAARLQLDVWYTRNLSWRVDLQILLLTIWRIATRHGARADPGALAPDLDVLRSHVPLGDEAIGRNR